MVDPLTALSVAATAVGQIKQLVNAGGDVSQALSKFAGAWSDISYAEKVAKNPPWYKAFSSSAEQEALDIFTAKRKMQEMKREVETLISFYYGPKGLEEYKNTIRQVREQRRKHEYKKQEIKRTILDVIFGTLLFLSITTLALAILYFIYNNTQL